MKRTVRVVPAILTDSTVELTRLVSLANRFAPFVQVDIMDGVFVPTLSIEVADLRAQDIRFAWEAHLMVSDPLSCLEPFRDAGARRVVFHFESQTEPTAVIDAARVLGLGVGLAVNPPTPVADITPLLPVVDSVLLMTVYPGYYGAAFVPEVMSKVAEVRAIRADVEKALTAASRRATSGMSPSGRGHAVRGSAVFASPDPEASYARLVALAQGSSAARRSSPRNVCGRVRRHID
jgi:ribulose-phosphate 3-epimerase